MYPDLSLKENVIHGTPQNPIQALHFTTGEGTPYPDYFFVDRHWHNYVEILFIARGTYHLEINLEDHILSEGDICILNSEELHQITGKCFDTIHDVLLFNPQILDFSYADEWEERFIAPFLSQAVIFQNILHPADSGYSDIRPLILRLMDMALRKEEGWYIRCKLLLLELFALMTRHHLLLSSKDALSATDARKIDRYKTIISYIEEHYREPISLKQLADMIPCNSQYLCRFFREISGMSPIRYLISCRLEKACTLLLHTSQPVTEIALDCGFENISYFIRQFKADKGCTPKEYRRRAKIFSTTGADKEKTPVFTGVMINAEEGT